MRARWYGKAWRIPECGHSIFRPIARFTRRGIPAKCRGVMSPRLVDVAPPQLQVQFSQQRIGHAAATSCGNGNCRFQKFA